MKKNLTKEQIYKKNQKKIKTLRAIAPVVYWGCLVLCLVCLVIALRNSFGNISEIISKLSTKNLTGEELATNYAYLVDKYGEWVIGSGSKGFTITFIDISNALFSGIMLLSMIGAIITAVCSVLLGKWLLPHLAKSIEQSNQDMVNIAVLKDIENK